MSREEAKYAAKSVSQLSFWCIVCRYFWTQAISLCVFSQALISHHFGKAAVAGKTSITFSQTTSHRLSPHKLQEIKLADQQMLTPSACTSLHLLLNVGLDFSPPEPQAVFFTLCKSINLYIFNVLDIRLFWKSVLTSGTLLLTVFWTFLSHVYSPDKSDSLTTQWYTVVQSVQM